MNDNTVAGILIIGFIIGLSVILSSVTINSSYITNENVPTSFADTGHLDAFGRLRVSEVTSIIDIKHLYDKEPLFVDERVNGNGVATWKDTTVEMNTSASGDYVVRQTFQRAFYQNGKSQQIFMTFDSFEPQTNIIKRIGYFTSTNESPYNDDFDGLFLSSEGGKIYTNIYNGGILMEKVSQSDWNINTLDYVNWSKSQILQIDFEWLGVGRVRWNMVIDGKVILFHETNHANNINGVYMLSPNKPLRWEIRQTGAGSGNFNHICATVGTEGSLNSLGVERSVNTDSVPVLASSISEKYVVIAIRLDEQTPSRTIDVLRFTLLALSNANYYWELHLDSNFSAELNWNDLNNLDVDYAIGTGETLTSDGFVLESGFATGKTVSSESINNALRLGVDLNLKPQTLALVVTPLAPNMNIHGSLTFRQIR